MLATHQSGKSKCYIKKISLVPKNVFSIPKVVVKSQCQRQIYQNVTWAPKRLPTPKSQMDAKMSTERKMLTGSQNISPS